MSKALPPAQSQDQATATRRRIFRIERLAAMPQVVWQLLEALGDERSDASSLQKIVESDQALTSKVLSLANSAYYGQPQKITTVRRAVLTIGYQELQLLALGTGLSEVFDLRKVPAGFDGEGLWLHCLAVSCTAKFLAEAAGHPNPGEVMIGGLLHDLGKLVLATHLTEELGKIQSLVEQGLPYDQAEGQMGLAHTTLGYWLAKKWALPDIHCAVIRDHHAPRSSDPFYTSTCMVLLADGLAKSLGMGLALAAPPADLSLAMAAAGLNLDSVRSVAGKAREQLPALLDSWRATLGKDNG